MRALILCSILLMLNFLGCAYYPRKDPFEPITRAQKDFYRVRILHQKAKSRAVVERSKKFLKDYPGESLACPIKYYLALNYERLGEKNLARRYYQEIVQLYPQTGWSELAQSNLKTLDES